MPQPKIKQRIHQPRRLSSSAWAVMLVLTAATPAIAQETGSSSGADERTPYYFGISQAFSRDSNLFRTATNEVSDILSSTGLLAGFDQLIGRQRLYADVSAQINRYQDNDDLDNKSFAVNAGLNWETIEFLSGTLLYSARNSLANFGTLDGSTVPSDQISQQFLASARYGLTSRFALDAGYEYRNLKYRSDFYASRNYHQNMVRGGVEWGTAGALVFGLGYRATRGYTPQYQNTPPYENELDRRDIDFTTDWTPTGASTLNLRLSSTKETQTLASNNERTGFTGSLSWSYQPTGKLGFLTSITRDTGTESTFLGIPPGGSTPLPVDESTISTTTQVQVRYQPTSKIRVNGDLRYRKGTLSGGEEERLSGYALGISYEPTRSITLGCDVIYEDRNTSGLTSYTATVSTCSGQFTLR